MANLILRPNVGNVLCLFFALAKIHEEMGWAEITRHFLLDCSA